MVFVPTYTPPPQNNKRKNSNRSRTGMGGMVKNSLNTSQGVSTLKIVLIFSVVGMVLNWVLPIVILEVNPEMLEEDAHYFGTVAAIVITAILLVISLVSQFIFRSKSNSENSRPLGINTDIYRQDNSESKGNLDDR